MLFNSFVFLVLFLPVTYTVFWLLRNAQQRYIWLAITGYVFYGYWNPKFCLLMAFSTLVSYTAGLGFLKYPDNARARKLCLVLPVTVDLLLLGFFKYANFVLRSIGDLSALTGHPIAVAHFDIVLPIGISFYTFHTISYIVDSYRKTIKPTRNFFEFAAYVSLFSQLIAGPIVRFRQIESDLDNLGTADRNRWLERGIRFFIIGLVMKVLVADSLAANAGCTGNRPGANSVLPDGSGNSSFYAFNNLGSLNAPGVTFAETWLIVAEAAFQTGNAGQLQSLVQTRAHIRIVKVHPDSRVADQKLFRPGLTDCHGLIP